MEHFPNAMQEALDAQAGLDWTHTGVSSGEFSAMQSAVATPEQREAILQVIDEASTSINGQFLELFASDMAELVYGPPPRLRACATLGSDAPITFATFCLHLTQRWQLQRDCTTFY